ncbi:helix-turn-helix domain-containing protein [Niallia sp. JL1B1071]|uniref:helix-turn-helix domain-containing protein n=1 Tax=Niallia tiangongensis TaxID=3237105 RepID=UPI0037DC2DA3
MKRDWLINIRKYSGLTQLQVASRCFIDRGYYAHIESGLRQPSLSVAKKISSVLSFSPALFFAEDFDDPFQMSLEKSPIMIAHCNLDLRYTWIFNPHPNFDAINMIGRTDKEIAENEGLRRLRNLKREVISSRDCIRELIEFPLSDGGNVYDFFGKPLMNRERIIGVITISTEVTHLIR